MEIPRSRQPDVSRRTVLRTAVVLGAGAAAAGGALLTPSAHAQVSPPAVHGRGAWGARPPRSPVTIRNHRPNKIIVHHAASGNVADTSLGWAFQLSRAIQNWHMDNNGWIDAGQQFTISRGGHIMEGRDRSLPTLNGGTTFVHGAHAGVQNSQAIGIENEGTYVSVAPPAALYQALVHMCAHICQQYAIPASEIYGHRQFSSTQCPGNVLFGMLPQLRSDVAAAMSGGGGGGGDFESIVDSTGARFVASGNWDISSFSGQRHGSHYHFAQPVLASDAAWFRVNIPSAGTYQVDAWWPADPGYNDRTPFVISTSGGSQTVHVNQRSNGGRWVNLGSFPLAAGDHNVVGVSRWTTGAGLVIADAVRVRS
jgi:hypothetical protein